jgi:hypothetical protein
MQRTPAKAKLKFAKLENKIEQAEEEANKPYLPKLTPEQQIVHSNNCKLISQKREKVKGHEGQAFAMIKSICTERLLHRMKQDPSWDVLLLATDPLQCLDLIEKTMCLTSTDHYVFAVAYKQHKDFFNFQQNTLGNNAYYDTFNTRIKVAMVIGIHWADENCLKWVIEICTEFAAHKGTDYKDLAKAVHALV